MKEMISRVKNEDFIRFHAVIESGSYTYAILDTLAKAEEELKNRRDEQAAHPENYDSTDVDWQLATTRELNIGDEYKPHTIYQHGVTDGTHGSKKEVTTDTRYPIRRGLIVNV
jgi:hypothetical protein